MPYAYLLRSKRAMPTVGLQKTRPTEIRGGKLIICTHWFLTYKTNPEWKFQDIKTQFKCRRKERFLRTHSSVPYIFNCKKLVKLKFNIFIAVEKWHGMEKIMKILDP